MATSKQVLVPDIGGHANVPVIEIMIKAGDHVDKDQSLITLESDKATMEVPSPQAGIVKAVELKVGQEVSEGMLIALLEVDAAEASQVASDVDEGAAAYPPPAADVAAVVPPSAPPSAPRAALDASLVMPATAPYASPAVRALARELGVNIEKIQGSGRSGRIQREDVLAYVKQSLANAPASGASSSGGNGLNLLPWPQPDFSQFGDIEKQPLTRIQNISGANLARNWAMIPHVTQHIEADITDLEAFRKQLGTEHKDLKISPLVFQMKAVVAALKVYPTFNASLDQPNGQLILKKYFHLGIAVDTPAGLVVPVIRDVDQKGLLELAHELIEVAQQAREKKLKAAQLSGGCFSISSLGGIGGSAFTPIVNAPEVAILGVSKASIKPVWNGQEFTPRLMLPLSLSYDHRVIDGALAARFAVFVARQLADIRRLLL